MSRVRLSTLNSCISYLVPVLLAPRKSFDILALCKSDYYYYYYLKIAVNKVKCASLYDVHAAPVSTPTPLSDGIRVMTWPGLKLGLMTVSSLLRMVSVFHVYMI